MRALRAFLIGAAVTLAAAPAADAKVGAGVGAAPIVLAAPAKPASTYSLPSMWVVNTGDESAVYRVSVARSTRRGNAAPVPTSWVQIGRDGFELAPGDGAWVPLELRVPRGAEGGRYEANLVAGTVRQNAGGAGLGAAAATRLQFVVAGGAKSPTRRPASASFTTEGAIAVAVAGAALTVQHLRRRSRSAA